MGWYKDFIIETEGFLAKTYWKNAIKVPKLMEMLYGIPENCVYVVKNGEVVWRRYDTIPKSSLYDSD